MRAARLRFLFEGVMELLIIMALAAGIILGFKVNYLFFLVTGLGIIFFLVYVKNKAAKASRINKENIADRWGAKRNNEAPSGDVKKLFLYLKQETENKQYQIDDTTWNDLDMDLVFRQANHTISVTGAQYLYYLLRNPVFDQKLLAERAHIINRLMQNDKTSQSIQFHLLDISNLEDVSFKIFNRNLKYDRKLSVLYRILSLIIIAEIILAFFYPALGITLIALSVFINFIIHNYNKYRIFEEISELKYFRRLIGCAQKIIKVDTEGIDLGQSEIRVMVKNLRKISRNLSFISIGTGVTKTEIESFLEIINSIFLIEPIIFFATMDLISRHQEDLLKLHMLVGRIDALIAMASYKKSLNYFCCPKLSPYKEAKDIRYFLQADNLYHPLLKKPVSNSVKIKKRGVIITGSNASGKSTFLKAIGINAIFAQSVFFSFSESYLSFYYKIFTSIGTTDNIEEGESYFMAEARLLKRIIDEGNSQIPVLCILDEIFRGTNTVERISSGLAVLKYFTDRNFCVINATHDLELASLAKNFCQNFHFREEIKEKDIIFSYILHQGICKTKNAIKILKSMDYPEEIYEKAINISKGF